VPVLIDFERCTYTPHPANVTQFLQFISSDKVRGLLQQHDLTVQPLAPHDPLLKSHKEEPSLAKYLTILEKLGLATFNERCYARLCKVPKGQVTTYNDLARAIGSHAYRAVGQAMNKNPYAPDVPCHRVVAAQGKIGGFASGTKAKILLLKKEGVYVKKGKIENFKKINYRFVD
jgi:methylated-DNA-[protein]-cysteine S-methyltransferase